MTPIKWKGEGGRIVLGLPSDLDLPMAMPLTECLRKALAAGEPVEIDADSVERVSSACVQALLAATRRAAELGLELRVIAPSVALVESCAELGLGPWLSEWSRQ